MNTANLRGWRGALLVIASGPWAQSKPLYGVSQALFAGLLAVSVHTIWRGTRIVPGNCSYAIFMA